MSPRIIQLPFSGRDRRHYAAEIKKAESAHARVVSDCDAARIDLDTALARYYRLTCEEWTILQFIGGDAAPSPVIAHALLGGCELLEVQCRHCNHTELIDLTLSIWPRTAQVHTLRGVLFCRPCMTRDRKKRRPDLVALRIRNHDDNAPAAAKRRAR
jgi:hypothetical protein